VRILVTGASGHLGHEVVAAAAGRGHAVRGTGRRAPASAGEWAVADLRSGDGLVEAVRGVDAIVHAASDARDRGASDPEGTRRLVEAARAAGVGQLLFVSIVGIDRLPLTYYRHKLACEAIVEQSGVPFTILRASQFHYFVELLLTQAARVPLVVPVPAGFRVQSIGTGDVAARIVELVEAGPIGRAPDLAGPEPMLLMEAARRWKAARGIRKPLVPVPVPGELAAGFRAGYNTVPARPYGRETWGEWLGR